MLLFFLMVITVLASLVFFYAWQSRSLDKQRAALNAWQFDPAYIQAVLLKYPHLDSADVTEAFEQLRLYFYLCWKHEGQLMAMPSVLVDTCWHVFLVDTRRYLRFCESVFDYYFHHEPPALMSELAQTQRYLAAAARVYQGVVRFGKKPVLKVDPDVDDAVDVQAEGTAWVPVLFSIDDSMKIADGFWYSTAYLTLLAQFDLKGKDAAMAGLDGVGGASIDGASCGDGGACGCGGSA